jgi:hypothetical protein
LIPLPQSAAADFLRVPNRESGSLSPIGNRAGSVLIFYPPGNTDTDIYHSIDGKKDEPPENPQKPSREGFLSFRPEKERLSMSIPWLANVGRKALFSIGEVSMEFSLEARLTSASMALINSSVS